MRHREPPDLGDALDIMREALTDWQGMIRQETGPARRAMQALLKGRLVFTPQHCDGEQFYAFDGEGTISPVIAGVVKLQREWWPQRDAIELARFKCAISLHADNPARVQYSGC